MRTSTTMLALLAMAAVPGLAGNSAVPSVLTLEERVKAQTAIERVFYNHRILPKENPGPKPPFGTMVPESMIRGKAADVLQMSAALRRLWNIEITPAMLQAEMDRMERGSKDRATLHELFAALGNDPGLIAETLARRRLAGEMIRGRYAHDAAIHAQARARAGAVAARAREGADWSGLGGDHSIRKYSRREEHGLVERKAERDGEPIAIALSPEEFEALRGRLGRSDGPELIEEETGWRLERRLQAGEEELTVETLWIPKRDFSAWWAETRPSLTPSLTEETAEIAIPRGVYRLPDPLAVAAGGCDVWARVKQAEPVARQYHTAVWTGNEMIVWGGYNGAILNTGGRYNPATDSWLATSTGANLPSGRQSHTAIWTGSEMIVWGGSDGPSSYLNTGGRYNPATDTWLPTSLGANLPTGRSRHAVVWTGSPQNYMIAWGGYAYNYVNTGGIYYFLTQSPPASPANTLRGGKSATLNLSWAASSGATSYNVKRCAGACAPAAIAATPTTNSYSEPMNASTYFYAVEAVNACGATP